MEWYEALIFLLGMVLSLAAAGTMYVLGTWALVMVLPAETLANDLTPVATGAETVPLESDAPWLASLLAERGARSHVDVSLPMGERSLGRIVVDGMNAVAGLDAPFRPPWETIAARTIATATKSIHAARPPFIRESANAKK